MGLIDEPFFHKQLSKMLKVSRFVVQVLLIFVLAAVCCADTGGLARNEADLEQNGAVRIFEQGRTFVRNTFKRFAILLPAIFFKLGIAFTMLVLVTIVSVNNGFIGFLLLVVGLSSVLARLQESRRPATAPAYYNPPPAPYYNPVIPVALRRHYRHDWDRSDVDTDYSTTMVPNYGQQQYVYSYNPASYAQTRQT